MRNATNPILRRLREVDQNREELAAEIKRLERALKKPERLLDNPRVPPSAPRIRTTARPPQAGRPEPAAPAAPEPAAPPPPERHAPVAGNANFARYFSSTRFLGPPALRHERRVQRNRAIVLLVVVILLISLVIHFIR